MQDEENLQRAHNEVPTDDELNVRLARGPAELATFRAIDAEMDATSQPMGEPACSNRKHGHFSVRWQQKSCQLPSCK